MNFKKLIPHAVALVIFWIITAAFFSPLVFDGKKIGQSDIQNYKGSAQEIIHYRETHNGQEPLWTNSMFGGMPAYQISTTYPNNYVQYVAKIFTFIIATPATAIFLCMAGFYFLLITLNVNPWVSIGGGVAFGFSSFFIIILQVGHNTQAFAIAYMAPVLAGVLIATRGRLFLGGAITALALALELYSNHLQITYYLMMTTLVIGLGEALRLFREGKMKYLLKTAGVLGAAVFLAVLPNLTNLYLTEQYGKYSTRGPSDLKGGASALDFKYVTQYSYPVGETMTLMIPNIAGGASQSIAEYAPSALDNIDSNQEAIGNYVSAYFGAQGGTAGPVYVGAIICFLFVLGLFIVKDNLKWWLLGATVLSIFLSWGENFESFSQFFFNYFPAYNKFRAVSMILVIAELTMPILAMLAVQEILKNPGAIKKNKTGLYISFGLTGGIAFLIWLMPSAVATPINPESREGVQEVVDGMQIKDSNEQKKFFMDVQEVRYAIVKSDALRSFALILFAGALIFFYVRKPFGLGFLAGGLGLLMLFDMYGVATRYLHDDEGNIKGNYNEVTDVDIPQTTADKMILQDPDPDYRVMNIAVNTWADGSTSYWHKSIGGYHGAKLKRIQELYDSSLSVNMQAVRNAFGMQGVNDSILQEVLKKQGNLNMLNTRYIIYNPKQGGVLMNRHACGNAWFVREVKMVDDANAELKAVRDFSPRRTAFVDKKFAATVGEFQPKYDSTAHIKLTSYEPNDLKYESNAASDQFAVFSEIYYEKGWDVFVDGQPSSYVRADYVLRAMRVPAGKHEIEFKFEPKFYFTGEKIALAGSFLLFIFIGGGIYMDSKERKKEAAKKAA